MGELYYSRNFGPELQMIFMSGRAGTATALIATPRRDGTGVFRLSSTLSLLFLVSAGGMS